MIFLLLGCSLQGAGDPFPQDPGLSAADVQRCIDGELPDRAQQGSDRSIDRSAGGKLKGSAPSVSARGVSTIVALDYSGSMFGGYEASESGRGSCGWTRSARGGKAPNGEFYWSKKGFQDLLEQGVLAGVGDRDPTWAMVFNSTPMLLEGSGARVWDQGYNKIPEPSLGAKGVLQQLSGQALGGSLADQPWKADFGPKRMWDSSEMAKVLLAAEDVFESQEQQDGVLWILTDNIIDTGDGAQASEAQHNRAFYEALAADPRWQVVYAWPVSEGDWLCESTLLVYGLYYSPYERIDRLAYERLTQGPYGRLGKVSQIQGFAAVASPSSPAPGQPFKLKPDDLDLVEPEFVGTVDCGSAKATGLARTCTAALSLENQLQHRRVEAATLSLSGQRLDAWDRSTRPPTAVLTAIPLASTTLSASTSLQAPIPAHEAVQLELVLKVPPIETELHTLRDRWESSQHPRFGMVGLVDMELSGLKTAMAIDPAQLGDVYGVESLPQVFENPNTEHLSRTVCVMMTVDNPSYFSSLLLVSLLGLAGLSAVLGTWLLKPTWRHVVVDGIAGERVRLSRLLAREILVDNQVVAKARLNASGRIVLRAVKPYRLTPKGGAWELSQREEEFDARRKLELKSRVSRRSSAKESF